MFNAVYPNEVNISKNDDAPVNIRFTRSIINNSGLSNDLKLSQSTGVLKYQSFLNRPTLQEKERPKQETCALTDGEILKSMHSLRYQVFIEDLNWTVGVNAIGQMEFDDFDTPDAAYLVYVNEETRAVDACARFITTDKPNMLSDVYPHFVGEDLNVPRSPRVCEITRFAINKESKVKGLFPKMIAAIIEWGLQNDIQSFVSLTTTKPFPIFKALKKIGWDPDPIGEEQETADDTAVALKYTCSEGMLQKVGGMAFGRPLQESLLLAS